MNFKEKLKASFCLFVSFCICVLSVFCVVTRFFDIGYPHIFSDADNKVNDSALREVPAKTPANSKSEDLLHSKQDVNNSLSDADEGGYPILEVDLTDGYTDYDNFSVNNSTDYSLDIEKMLSDKLGFDIKDTREVQVLIVHTHTCESYMNEDSNSYSQSFYPRTTDNNKNVYSVGEKIAQRLKANGIGVVHADIQHDSPSYDGAYSRSYDTIMSYLEKYSEIKVVLDIHRDSMTKDDNTKLKPVFEYNGKKGAQIMIMSGYDPTLENFPTWKDNLTFALKLQSMCETMYPSMTRPLNFGNFTYNMNANNGSLLIEVGTDANSLQQAQYSGELLGNALSQVLQNA